MNYKLLLYFTLASIILQGCKPHFNHQITRSELKSEISFLASDSLKGRFPGTAEDKVLRNYITDKFDKSGLLLLGDNGLQYFDVDRGYVITDKNSIESGNKSINTDSGLTVLGFSSTDTVTGLAVFTNSKYTKSLEGKIVFTPLPDSLPKNSYDTYNALRSDALEAADQGIEALVYLMPSKDINATNPQRQTLPIPVAAMEASQAESLLNTDFTNTGISDRKSGNKPRELRQITFMTEVLPGKIQTANTLALTKGSDPDLKDQYLIIGAHHDHLGFGGRGSSSRRQDTIAIHYGADDNASGVAGVIELSQDLMSRSPARSILFSTFAAEELGLDGSHWLADHSPIDLDKVQVMINLDMIGRLKEDRQLQIGGVGTSPVFRTILDTINKRYGFTMSYSEAGYGPSDHSSFYAKDIPVLFVTTGAHTDYHTPADSEDKINYDGMVDVLSYISDVAYTLANLPEQIEFTLAGPKEASGSKGRYGGVTFGLMPDVIYDGNDGMPVSFVTEGKPAAIGGMKGGDIIKEVDGMHVGNVQDYMVRLSKLKEGQSVIVKVERDGETLELLLKL